MEGLTWFRKVDPLDNNLITVLFQALQDEIKEQQPQYETYTSAAITLVDECNKKSVTDDLPVIEDEIGGVKERWGSLQGQLDEQLHKYGTALEDAMRFQEIFVIIEQILIEVEEIVTVEFILAQPNAKQAKDDLGKVKVHIFFSISFITIFYSLYITQT